jgi:hypothetical protein
LTRAPDHPAAGSYLLEKGKNLATLEDLNRIVATTEEIKAQDSGEWWIKQKRWETKFQCYSQVVEHLGELHTILSEAIGLMNVGPGADVDPAGVAHARGSGGRSTTSTDARCARARVSRPTRRRRRMARARS